MASAEYEERIIELSGALDRGIQDTSEKITQSNEQGWWIHQIFTRNFKKEGEVHERIYAVQRRRPDPFPDQH